ncbi:MAG TPA: hypothetical protein VL625_13080 [Patescibacteria group bacterium]|nr:hypothetical protein [Patescibacteria group bacterium]
MMDVKQLEKIMSVYGADMARWPEEMRGPARALLADSQAARNLYKQAEALDHALDAFTPPPLPAGLAVRAANESLMRARTMKKKPGFALPKFSFGAKGFWMPAGGLVAVTAAIVLIFATSHQPKTVPTQDVAEVDSLVQTVDQQANAEERDIKDMDDMIAMLDSTQPSPPQQANPDGGATSDEMMKTLFDDNNGQDDDSWLQKL